MWQTRGPCRPMERKWVPTSTWCHRRPNRLSTRALVSGEAPTKTVVARRILGFMLGTPVACTVLVFFRAGALVACQPSWPGGYPASPTRFVLPNNSRVHAACLFSTFV